MTGPRFTVAIAAYNYGRYLQETVRSVLAQTYRSFEIVISDDFSSDDTFEIARRFASRDPRIRCWRNECNLGSRGNINKCYREARGEFVIPLQADDAFLRPDHLACVAAMIDAYPHVGFVFNAGLFVTNEGSIARRYVPFLTDVVGHGRYFLSQISRLPPWPSFTAINRALLDRLGGEDESLVVADFELSMRVVCSTEVAYLATPSVVSRVHDQAQGIRVGCGSEEAVCRNNIECLDAFARRFPCDDFAQKVIDATKSLFIGGYRKGNLPFYRAQYLAGQFNPLLARWRSEGRRIGLYAAGEHTRRLFEWTNLDSDDVICVVDIDPRLHGTAVGGCRVVPPEAAFSADLDVIVVSSLSHQDEILFALGLAVGPRVEIVTLYPRQFIGFQEALANLQTLSSGMRNARSES